MKVLIGVLSCLRDRPHHQKVRETWLKDCSVDYRFILGTCGIQPEKDEICFDTADRNLVGKISHFVKYANDYDFVFKCDIDTFVHVPRLLKSGFENHDYINEYGGIGYWLSKRSLKVLASSLIVPEDGTYMEDAWVKRNLNKANIISFKDSRYHSLTNLGPEVENDLITTHWYSDGSRIIRSRERMNLLDKYYKKAQEI